jgi:hypothetical protein
MISWFLPQNQVGYGLSVTGHALRSSGLLHLKASRLRVFQSSIKTDGGAMRMVHVTSSRRSCGDETEDGWVNAMGCIRLFYSNFVVFIVLRHKGSLVISFPINRTPMFGGENQAFNHLFPTP